jgi:glycosyltransferase involved in cell wall biosynthesis
MNQFTFDHPFCSVIPNAVSEDLVPPAARRTFESESSASAETKPAPQRPPVRYRGILFPERTFAVLWTGGFNTWTDTSMLAGALSLAMEQLPDMRFVCSGGAIPGHDELSFRRFQDLMEQTGFSERCLYLGWVESGELEALHRECDLAVNVDSMNYETYFGARNRITNWMGLGIPIVTTVGTEISEVLEDHELGYTVKTGDVVGLSEVFLRAARRPAERKAFGTKARKFALEHFNYEATTRGLLKWAAQPQLAPDNSEKVKLAQPGQPLENITLNDLEAETVGLVDNLHGTVRHLRAELEGIRSHPFYKAFKALQRLGRKS